MTDQSKKIAVFDKYILSQRIHDCDCDDVEIWKGRHRKSNQHVTVYIFLKKLSSKAVSEIKKWVTLSSYEISAFYVIRYLEFITVQKVEAVILKRVSTISLDRIMNEPIPLYEGVIHFQHLVRGLYFIHGTGTFHGNLTSSSILKDCITEKLKVWKNPIEIMKSVTSYSDDMKADEYKRCGTIFLTLFRIDIESRRRVTKSFRHVDAILDCYLEENPKKRIKFAAPENVHKILEDNLFKIMNDYSSQPIPRDIKMVDIVSLYRDLNLQIPCPSTVSSLLTYFRDVLPQVKSEMIENKSRQNLKVIAKLCGICTPSTSELFVQNVVLSHSLISEEFRRYNTKLILSLIKDSHEDIKIENILSLCETPNNNSLRGIIDMKHLEEIRIWYREQYFLTKDQKILEIHDFLVIVIVAVDEWFYDSFGVGKNDILLKISK